eukprot:TRINITY_DN517_c0_g1_i3.p1 TRINITY_DN517_c0_g1~~TRINITY_DN517_c0_g1_i3.p1  ORF type:complete len:249 (+),score=31.00 TRINITY_DN517_c0_g1_i3:297-1043(+)
MFHTFICPLCLDGAADVSLEGLPAWASSVWDSLLSSQSRHPIYNDDTEWIFDPLQLLGKQSQQERESQHWRMVALASGTGWGSDRSSSMFAFSRMPESRREQSTALQSSSKSSTATTLEDKGFSFGDFFSGQLPNKYLSLFALLALSRLGIYLPLWGVNREAFARSLWEGTLLATLDTLSGGGIGRLGLFSLGIVPYINAQIVFQLLGTLNPKLQELQKREGRRGGRRWSDGPSWQRWDWQPRRPLVR